MDPQTYIQEPDAQQQVKVLQHLLNDSGKSIDITETMDQATRVAIEEFGFSPKWDEETKLIAAIQRLLGDKFQEKLFTDGLWGPTTERLYQKVLPLISEKVTKKEETNSDTSPMKSLIKLSDELLLWLYIKHRKKEAFRFWLRQRNNARSKVDRFKNGQWFQGSDYIFLSFYSQSDPNNKTQSIGLVFRFQSATPEILIECSFQTEEREEFLACYRAIGELLQGNNSFSGSHLEEKKYYFFYKQTDWEHALNEFLEVHKPIIDNVIDKLGLSAEFEISESKFESMLNRIKIERKGDLDKDADEYEQRFGQQAHEQVMLQIETTNVEDNLERKPFVVALYSYINKLWQADEFNDAYTIHLGGEWGSGKTKVLEMLKLALLSAKKNNGEVQENAKEWLVIDFNAWRNQHIDPPWWIFIDHVYKGIRDDDKITKAARKLICWKETKWRLFTLNRFYVWVFLGTLLLIGLSLIVYKNKPDGIIEKMALLTSSFSTIAGLWAISKAFSSSLYHGSSDAAKRFQREVRDPMKQLKDHYGEILQYTKKEVAIFIDDIDRCNPTFVVKLLEGIQTLFKSEKVLYVIAGDGRWIKQSFGNYYASLKSVVSKPGNNLGNFFLEKTFQLSIAVPRISDETKEQFWRTLLNGSEDAEAMLLAEKEKQEIKQKIKAAKTESEMDAVINEEDSPYMKQFARSEAVQEMADKDVITERLVHKLEQYYHYLEPNPRSMKRLINNYALERKAMMLSGISLAEVSDEHLIKWIMLKSSYPVLADKLADNPSCLAEEIKNYSSDSLVKLTEGLEEDVIASCVRR